MVARQPPGHGLLGDPINGLAAVAHELPNDVGTHAVRPHVHPVAYELVLLLLGDAQACFLDERGVDASEVKARHARGLVFLQHDDREAVLQRRYRCAHACDATTDDDDVGGLGGGDLILGDGLGSRAPATGVGQFTCGGAALGRACLRGAAGESQGASGDARGGDRPQEVTTRNVCEPFHADLLSLRNSIPSVCAIRTRGRGLASRRCESDATERTLRP